MKVAQPQQLAHVVERVVVPRRLGVRRLNRVPPLHGLVGRDAERRREDEPPLLEVLAVGADDAARARRLHRDLRRGYDAASHTILRGVGDDGEGARPRSGRARAHSRRTSCREIHGRPAGANRTVRRALCAIRQSAKSIRRRSGRLFNHLALERSADRPTTRRRASARPRVTGTGLRVGRGRVDPAQPVQVLRRLPDPRAARAARRRRARGASSASCTSVPRSSRCRSTRRAARGRRR